MLRDVLLMALGIVVAVLALHLQNTAHDLFLSLHNWRRVVKGWRDSWRGLLLALLVGIGIVFGIHRLDDSASKAAIEAASKRDAELIGAINKAIDRQTEAILKAIDNKGVSNGTNRTNP